MSGLEHFEPQIITQTKKHTDRGGGGKSRPIKKSVAIYRLRPTMARQLNPAPGPGSISRIFNSVP